MSIDPRRLRYLLAVARTGGVLAAADELQMTPSAVSQQIARLERETGHALMTRTSQGSALTAEGLVLAEAAQEIERTLLDAEVRLERSDAELRGAMRIGAFSSFLSVVIAPALPDWRRQLPGVHFDVLEADREPLLRSLKAGEIDAAIIEFDDAETATAPPRGVTELPLLDEPWKLVVPAGTLISDVSDIGRLEPAVAWGGTGCRRRAGAPALASTRRDGTTHRASLLRHPDRPGARRGGGGDGADSPAGAAWDLHGRCRLARRAGPGHAPHRAAQLLPRKAGGQSDRGGDDAAP